MTHKNHVLVKIMLCLLIIGAGVFFSRSYRNEIVVYSAAYCDVKSIKDCSFYPVLFVSHYRVFPETQTVVQWDGALEKYDWCIVKDRKNFICARDLQNRENWDVFVSDGRIVFPEKKPGFGNLKKSLSFWQAAKLALEKHEPGRFLIDNL